MYEASLDALVELATSGSHLDAKNDKVAALRAHVKAVHDGAIVASAGLKDSAGLEAASRPLRKGAVLFVDGADAETVWQQLQHRSRAVERWARAAELWLLEHGAGALALPSDGGDAALENEDDASMDDDEMGDDEGEEDDGGEDDGEEDDDGEEEGDEAEEVDAADDDEEEDDDEDNVERGEPGGVTENKFFSLQEMEDFIEEDEQILMTDPPPRDDDDGEEDDDEEEEEDDEMIGDGNDKYSDFFNDDGEDDAADDDGMLSDEEAALEAALDGDVAARSQTKHERQVAATKSRAREIEAENVMGIQDKPWELRGEIGAKERPQNSLLGIDATWQGRTQTAPPLDAAFTAAVEAAIRERVKEARYDELVEASLVHKALKNPKAKANAAGDDDGALGEKSQVGLGEAYEKEYVDQQEAAGGAAAGKAAPRDEALDAAWARLAGKLDALSHFVSVPKTAPLDVVGAAKRNNVSAVAFEDTVPTSESALPSAAPEEVHAPKRGRAQLLRSAEEATQEERRAERAGKKKARNTKRKRLQSDARIVSRLNPTLANPYEKERLIKDLNTADVDDKPTARKSAFGKSGSFFKQLEAETKQLVHGGKEKGGAKKRMKTEGAGKSASFKL
ncbi:Mpp10 protein-domain-containing protein [Pelagophyceae sp. CCMP2097]|nr:Mpp10 protein-domain-containing protein [Pelagophyceae sp. CCMP2097]